jgi:hypothetical protein
MSQCHCVHHKSHNKLPSIEPRPQRCRFIALCSLWERRKLHNEELNNLYCSHNTVRVMISGIIRWARHVARMGERRDVYGVLVGKPEGETTWET